MQNWPRNMIRYCFFAVSFQCGNFRNVFFESDEQFTRCTLDYQLVRTKLVRKPFSPLHSHLKRNVVRHTRALVVALVGYEGKKAVFAFFMCEWVLFTWSTKTIWIMSHSPDVFQTRELPGWIVFSEYPPRFPRFLFTFKRWQISHDFSVK